MNDTSASNKGIILIVDDIPENLKVLSKTLKQEGYEVRAVTSGSMALRVVRNATPDIILLDIKMPEMDGYEVCRVLKADPETNHIPIIFLSALDEVVDKVTAFSVGGVDYITKPFQFQEVLARVNNQLQLQAAKAEVERLNAELEKRVIQRTAQLEQEIVKRQRIQEELLYMALHDSLTELPNRAWLMDRLKQVVKRSQQNPHYLFAILFLDCDRFKLVNDSLGHMIGDQLLISISRRLESALRLGDTISRFGGDEFVILLEEINQPDDAIEIAQDLQEQMKLSFHLDTYEIVIDVSIGIVIGNQENQQPDHLLRNADLALYKAKEKGKGRYEVFERKMHSIALRNLQTETELRRALVQSQFVVYYQPIIALSNRKIVGFEALVRWLHPQNGLVFPDQFLKIAEDTGLILDLDRFVLKESCQQIKEWQNKFDKSLTINVNFSTQLFSQTIVSEYLRNIICQTQLNPSQLRI
ncbi:MAG: putative bifunctional diguanylate cyclase/phosphodiesterase, partial [Prochlorotrichaceae cyanobacterium]